MKFKKYSLVFTLIVIPFFTYAQGFSWAQGFTAIGGNPSNTAIGAIAVDNNNNTYTIGGFTGTIDVDQGPNIHNITSVGNWNMFLLKEDAAGNFLWVKHFPGVGTPNSNSSALGGQGITLDISGNIYITGGFSDTFDFDPGPSLFILGAPSGLGNAYVLKLNSSGDFIWAKQWGGAPGGGATGYGLATDSQNLYLSLGFGGTIDADPGPGVYNVTTPSVGGDILIVKLDASGNFIWAKQIGGNGADAVNRGSLTIDTLSNIYLTGRFQDVVDFDPGIGITNYTSAGGYDIFVAKYDSSGNYLWAKQIGSNNDDVGHSIALDPWGDVLVTGHFGGTVDLDPGTGVYNLTSNSTRSIFTLKLRNNGDFVWAQKAGYPTGLYEGRGITTDTAGNVYVVSYGYPTQKFDSSGNLLWTLATAGTSGWITLDNNNSIYLSGSFIGGNVDFDPGPGIYSLTAASPGGGFILKLCQNTPTTTLTASADTVCVGDTVWLTTPVVPGATRYYWRQNSNYFNDSNVIAVPVTLSAHGFYAVTVYGGSCPLYSNVVKINVFPTGNTSLTLSAPASAPPGQGVTVNAALTDPGSNYAIDWYRNGILLATNASPAYSFVKTAGDDTVYAILRPQTLCYDTAIISDTVIILTEKTDTSMAAAHLSLHAIHIYPNPFDNTFTVSGLQPGDRIILLDATGRVLLRKEAENIPENIDVKELAAGYYIIKLYAKEGNVKGNVPVVKR